MLVLHGILGRRANWRSFARTWVGLRAGWGAILVDLREHGESVGMPGPATVAAAGADLVPLTKAVLDGHGGVLGGVLGHSFGGKVAIVGAAVLREAGLAARELWVLDAPPGARLEAERGRSITAHVFEVLEGLPPAFEDRRDFVAQLVAEDIDRRTAQWLATNLIAAGPTWRFGLDLGRLRELIEDFAAIDLWPTLEAEVDAGLRAALVLGGRSRAVGEADRGRAEAMAAAGRLDLEILDRAGHWLHVDDPQGLLELLSAPPTIG
jgi:pimeloyl-ACP methyl ester carboxylesterase